MPITGGTVSFEQSRKLAEYENRKASITFNVTDEAGAADEVFAALDLARVKVLEALGYKALAIDAALSIPTSAASAAPALPKKSHKRKVTPPESNAKPEDIVDLEEIIDAVSAISTGAERVDPTEIDAAELTAAPRTVSDKDMTDAMTRTMQRLLPSLGRDLTTDKVKKYLATFVEFPKKSYDIPPEARQKFLDGLVELKP